MKNNRQLVVIAILFFFVVWFLLAKVINNEILLPTPLMVFKCMMGQVVTLKFWQTIAITIFRMMKGLLYAAVLGVSFGCISAKNSVFHDLFYPFEIALKTIPNISYIIISLIWLGSEKSVTMVGFLVLFPIFFANTQQAILAISPQYHEVTALYHSSWFQEVFQVDLPLIKPSIQASFQSATGLGFKVCVMAEILGRVQKGIGFQIDFARQNLDMSSVFAWTVWIILLSVVFDVVFRNITKKRA